MADKTISVEITGDASGLQAAVGQAQSALSNLEGSNKSASTSTQKNSSEIEKNTSAVGKNTSASKEAAAAKDNQTKSTQKNETATKTSTTAVDKNTEAVKKNSKETETAQKKQVSFSEKATESGRRWKEAGEGIDQMTKPLQRAAIATAAAGVASAKAAIDFEDNFANVKKTVEGTPEQLEAVKQGIIDMTTVGVNGHNAIPQTTAQLTELAAAGGQLGITTDNIIDFTEVMAQMGTATNLAGEEGAATLARFMNVTNTDQSKIRNLGSSIVDLGNNFATTEAEIASLALRMGETGGVIGISAQDILGYSTALSSMGIQAEAGGSAVSRIWMTMQKAVAGGDESLEKFAKVSGKSSKEFADQWKNDASGAFQDFIKGLSESEDQISTLDELGFGNIRDIAALQALASTKGIELMTDALERSNKAWEENTALQTEADAKAQTTAGQLAITKNNVVETARSLGEVMLPTITDVSAGVRTFAQNLNEMSDSGKKAVITAGAVTVGLGVLAKGTAGTIKTVGTITEGVGKFAKLAPTLASAVPYAAAAAAGITAVTLAVKAGQKIWYDSKFNWGDGFSEQAEKIAESAEALEELNSLAQETENLKLVINSPDSSPEQIEAAKSRLKEIAELLNQEYKLNIDTSDVDTAADKIENAIKTITNQERSELITDSRDLITDIYDKSDRYSDAVKNLPQMENELNLLKEKKQTYNDILSQMDLLNSKYEAGIVSNEEYNTQWDALLDKAEALGLDRQKGYTAVQQAYDAADKAIVKLTEDTDNLKNSRDELEASVNSATESLSKVLASDLLTGNTEGAQDTIDIFRELGEAVKETGASTDNIARQFATAKQGFTDFNEAIEAGAAGAMANDFIAYKESINDCGIEAVTTAAAIKNGFA
ncbi:MAG: phage tail tape measure protein, partial [Candidatus Ornithomonoglobus sp.]